MRKILLSAIAFMMSAVFAMGCSSTKQPVSNSTEIQTSAVSTALSYSQGNADYSIQDLKNLQDFLLNRPTKENLNGKPYDLDGDDAWTVFDLCLMKQNYLKNQQSTEDDNDILVAYFSRTGTTEKIAEYIIDLTGADSFEINAAVPYTDEDINYSNSSCRANKEQNDKSVRPEIADTIENIDRYDTIFVGYPIWWSEEPRIIDTFLESYDFSDKTVIPFCTSHSSGMSTSESNIKNLGVAYGELLDGRRFSADSTRDDVSDWLDTLNIRKESEVGVFDFETKTVMLNSGYEMPIIGLGTWTQDDDTVENSVYEALKDGYRLIDTAQYYGNETGVGRGIQKAIDEGIVTREEVFVTTKVMPSNYDRAYSSIDDSLKRLGLDYIDLMLIHQSGSNDTEVYKALCQGVKDGKLRSIGISNYYTLEEYERVTSGSDIKPAVVQNENHPFYQNAEFQQDIAKYGTVVESWYPFGGRGHTQDLFGNDTITEIANTHNKTSAQIILRWHLQAGYVTIPGSQNPDHILENISIFDFELTDEEMQRMAELHTGQRYENW